ncbi:unnamed protein product [Mesocestoides corti]|uniref:Uncharacterized protein n=1 Tax=Mesocestoides corti TaxID=53468 RepID=A0A0R3UBH3_MESCO|nr:unnamed protein product [Mesocestoides corti]
MSKVTVDKQIVNSECGSASLNEHFFPAYSGDVFCNGERSSQVSQLPRPLVAGDNGPTWQCVKVRQILSTSERLHSSRAAYNVGLTPTPVEHLRFQTIRAKVRHHKTWTSDTTSELTDTSFINCLKFPPVLCSACQSQFWCPTSSFALALESDAFCTSDVTQIPPCCHYLRPHTHRLVVALRARDLTQTHTTTRRTQHSISLSPCANAGIIDRCKNATYTCGLSRRRSHCLHVYAHTAARAYVRACVHARPDAHNQLRSLHDTTEARSAIILMGSVAAVSQILPKSIFSQATYPPVHVCSETKELKRSEHRVRRFPTSTRPNGGPRVTGTRWAKLSITVRVGRLLHATHGRPTNQTPA